MSVLNIFISHSWYRATSGRASQLWLSHLFSEQQVARDWLVDNVCLCKTHLTPESKANAMYFEKCQLDVWVQSSALSPATFPTSFASHRTFAQGKCCQTQGRVPHGQAYSNFMPSLPRDPAIPNPRSTCEPRKLPAHHHFQVGIDIEFLIDCGYDDRTGIPCSYQMVLTCVFAFLVVVVEKCGIYKLGQYCQ